MKLPDIAVIKAVAAYYGISSKGKFAKWLSLMNKNALVYYYDKGELKHIRVLKLLHLLNNICL